MRTFCTYFDYGYLLQGLTLYRSLARFAEPFTLHALCFDGRTHDVLSRLALPNLRPVPLSEFEEGDEALLAAKRDRSATEYYFTCSPSWPLYLLDRHPEIDIVTYLDADLLFYSSPEPVFRELGDESVLIVGHRFPESGRFREKYGIYNVGLLSFRNDPHGRECLGWWRDRCLEWCHDRVEDGRFADQKYLDSWPERFPRVVVLRHKGAGLAPWNWMNYRIETGRDGARVDGEPLVFYHFQGVRLVTKRLLDPRFHIYAEMPPPLAGWLYGGYARALRDTERWVRARLPGFRAAYRGLSVRGYEWREFVAALRGRRIVFTW